MSVLISIIGSKPESDEYQGAIRLKQILSQGLDNSVVGEIILHANATLVGQSVKDIDLLMMGTLHNYRPKLSFTGVGQSEVCDNVEITSFCTAIEIKSHDINGVYRQGTELYVRYGDRSHPVTTQSNAQKISVKNFFDRTIGFSPYVTNLIWFISVTAAELENLLKIDSGVMPSNALSSEYSANDLFQMLVMQKEPKYYQGSYHFDCYYNGHDVGELSRLFKTFAKAKESMGELTRKRIEQITSRAIRSSIEKPASGQLSIYKGRAGTGKTVGLIQTAIALVDEEDARVLILTYNRALVSDIRRLFTLAELPDMFSDSCVSINTMQSFFYRIIRDALHNGNLSGEYYLDHYEECLQELLDFLNSDNDSAELIRAFLEKDSYLSWDYCMIDEAQDWTCLERDIILKLFREEQVIIADGGKQFVRNVSICDWSAVQNKKSVKLKYCLRQKSNLIRFINHYLAELGKSENKIMDPGKMPGGRIIVCQDPQQQFKIYRDELKRLTNAGNIPYDMLFLAPASMVEKDDVKRFAYKRSFEDNGFFLWDGTDDETRKSFSATGNEERLLQYDSARGLEAWTVVCLNFDDFIEEKLALYCDDEKDGGLFLESAEDRRLNYIVNWILIPLTRAIDTIVITLSSKSSPTAETLRKLAKENPDYIDRIEEEE